MATDMNEAASVESEVSDEHEATYIPIDELQKHGVDAKDITRLKESGLHTVGSVVMATSRHLTSLKGITEARCQKIKAAATKLADTGFVSGTTALQRRERVLFVSTGSGQFDQLLGGGIETMSITEVYGEFRTGKTQLCHTLCVTCQLPVDQGGANGKVCYIDTEGTFRPERIRPIAERFGLDPDAALENIQVGRAYNHEHQMQLIVMAACRMAEDDMIKLIIVDSIMALFRVDYSGRGELSERQQKLAQMLSFLIKTAEEFNVAVFITNQVMADPGASSMFGPVKKPAGGHILSHASTTRLNLRKGRGSERIVKIADSPSQPEAEARYAISDVGIDDPTE